MVALSESGNISLVTAVLSATALVFVALIGRRQKEVHSQAVTDRKLLRENTQDIKDAIRPENGHATIGQGVESIGELARDMATKLDRIDIRLAEGEERFDRIEEMLDAREIRIKKLDDKSAEVLALVGDNHAMFKNYIEAWTPLAARAVGEWGVDGMKEEQTMKVTKKTKKKP
jgi:hypothetical protein